MYKAKNIVVCLDGTGNQIKENLSNVLKLYRTLDKNGNKETRQEIYYDQGVGTIGQVRTWGRLSQETARIGGLAFGTGLDDNVLQAYRFISRHYHEQKYKDDDGKDAYIKDRIYIFGYSRGAHTARVLAAFIYNMGLIKPAQMHLAGAALTAYKRSTKKNGYTEVINFNRITRPYKPSIEFLGLWDTVSSMIVPRPSRLIPIGLEKLRNTYKNPAVKTVRRATAIDERRRMFRLDDWANPQDYKPIYYAPKREDAQDIKHVWFPGVHGDVGGGHKMKDSGLSQYSLRWMIKEAMGKGLIITTGTADWITLGGTYRPNDKYEFPAPDPLAKKHHPYFSAWPILEVIPKLACFRQWKGFRLGIPKIFYFPCWEPRPIPEGAYIHESAILRKESTDVKYAPVNFPKEFKQVDYDGRKSIEWRPKKK